MLKRNRIFLSTYEAKVDEKNRISIPANYRNILDQLGSREVYAYSSFISNCVEVCTVERIEKLHNFLEEMDMFSSKRDAIATAVMADCEPMQIDAKGRVSLPERLVSFAKLDKKVFFVGKGNTFEIWNQDSFKEYYIKSREEAKNSSFIPPKSHDQSSQ